MSIILIGGEKGGTGKTTLAVNLAALRALKGRDVLVMDTDIQASASDWAQTRDETAVTPRVACIQKFGKGLQTEAHDLAKRYQDLIIDAGGRDSLELRAALVVAGRISPSSPRSSTSGRWGGWTTWSRPFRVSILTCKPGW
jgi:chromosome partitioning protein